MRALLIAVLMLAAWGSSAAAQTCKTYVPGCKSPEFIEGVWGSDKPPWWSEEIPGIFATMTPKQKETHRRALEAELVGSDADKARANETLGEMILMKEFRPTAGVQHPGCVFAGNKWIGWRLEFPPEVMGCQQ
jgi:hypothetical protein